MRLAPERFEALDSWRGLCALLVVIYHFCFIINAEHLRNAFIENAYLFVDFFFVLSGFVVAHAYRHRLDSPRAIGGFILRRFGRLWPLHGAVLFAMMLGVMAMNVIGLHPETFAARADQGNYSLLALLLHAVLLNSVGLYGNAWNSPAWSIGSEFYTYILFALVAALAGRRLLGAALVLVVAALLVLLLAAPAYMNSTADFGLVRCIAGFFAGVVVQHVHAAMRGKPLPAAGLVEIAALVVVAVFVVMAGDGPDEVRVTSLLAPLVFGGAVLVFAREGGTLSRLLKVAPLRALGCWSYSIYMVHMPVLLLAGYGLWLYGQVTGTSLRQEVLVNGHAKQLYDLGHPAAWVLLLAAVLLATLALASLTYRVVEQPWRGRFGRLAKRFEVPRGRTPRAVGALVPVPVTQERRSGG
ncbi:acyltransferase family protein [Ancylobacter lacus]|uniref:acyltransferase family protein n=1 Tax=Ancylobacter lacus TaxID=2579970 RepID=UPI001BD11BEA|nr:acyltransferase [Ancylobacter lacus]MBS7539413.1 acyltransferase [Ancylobacter lacus]